MQKILIKNMVCPRCITAVRTLLFELDIPYIDIQLGEITVKNSISINTKEKLKLRLNDLGFDLLDDFRIQLIEKVKTTLINLIQHSENEININYSDYLSETLGKDYRYLSTLFSSLNGITIEKYIIQLKVEKIKEYMFYDELSISEIAYRMHYSSPAHLSRQFKQVCGLSPNEYKKRAFNNRKPLDQI